MAIWKSENAMLTKKGVEILNKIKAGIGGITVTKIAASSGRVAPSQLYNATDLTGSQKNMELSQKITDAVGSELSVYITNTGFVAPFTINQIGVYVTHPDYSGNQLYYIAQCEEGNPDILPIFDETPVTLGYSLYLEHGNSSAITIEVSTQGVITVEAFDQFKEGLTTTLESKADLVGGTLPISQLPPGLTDGRGGIKKFLTSETDPTVPSWAKQSSKPSYTASEVGAAPKVHKHDASDINAGTLSSDRLPLVPVSKGGTGASNAQDARTNLGAAPVSHKHNASDITSGTFSTDRLPVVPITKGGTGATDKTNALSNLGAAPIKHKHNAEDITSGILNSNRLPTIPESKLPVIPITLGGTGATKDWEARNNLNAASKDHTHETTGIKNGLIFINFSQLQDDTGQEIKYISFDYIYKYFKKYGNSDARLVSYYVRVQPHEIRAVSGNSEESTSYEVVDNISNRFSGLLLFIDGNVSAKQYLVKDLVSGKLYNNYFDRSKNRWVTEITDPFSPKK